VVETGVDVKVPETSRSMILQSRNYTKGEQKNTNQQ
jgi:hypothetical protein